VLLWFFLILTVGRQPLMSFSFQQAARRCDWRFVTRATSDHWLRRLQPSIAG